MEKTFQEEQDYCLEYQIKNLFFNQWQMPVVGQPIDWTGLELFITPVCNQECVYCYLVQHGNELYPPELRNTQTICHNMELLLDYFIIHEISIPKIDLYSGEIWGTEFGRKILAILLQKIDEGLKVKAIMIPSNCSFIVDPSTVQMFEDFDDALEKRQVDFYISASIDGYIVEKYTRPFSSSSVETSSIKNQEFFDKIFKLCFKRHWGFHPMISSESIELWKENVVWWYDMFKKFQHDTPDHWYNYIMFLEVRNDSWTDDKIISFIDFLNFFIDFEISSLWNGNVDLYLKDRIFGQYTRSKNDYIATNNQEKIKFPMSYAYNCCTFRKQDSSMRCSVGGYLNVRLGDLSIIPCHRTCYPELIYGDFIVKDDTIQGIHAKNPLLMNAIVGMGGSLMFKCSSCPIRDYCIKGCLGSQLESTDELFQPIESVCNLYLVRIMFLYYKIHSLNFESVDISELDQVMNELLLRRKDLVEKWKPIIMKII